MNCLLLTMLLACGKTTGPEPIDTPAPAETPAPPEAALDFIATLTIDEQPGGKRFQGVWLAQEGGTRWLVAYRKREPWTWFEGKRVHVTGERFVPDPMTQHIMADHITVTSLELLKDEVEDGADPIGIGPVVEMTGVFAKHTGEAGSKIEGQTWTTFTVEGEAMPYQAPGVDLEGERTVRVRVVKRSPYVARMGGDEVWVVE